MTFTKDNFVDDGGGMDPEGIRRCMSLGFSSKRSKTTIGQCNHLFLILTGGVNNALAI